MKLLHFKSHIPVIFLMLECSHSNTSPDDIELLFLFILSHSDLDSLILQFRESCWCAFISAITSISARTAENWLPEQ